MCDNLGKKILSKSDGELSWVNKLNLYNYYQIAVESSQMK